MIGWQSLCGVRESRGDDLPPAVPGDEDDSPRAPDPLVHLGQTGGGGRGRWEGGRGGLQAVEDREGQAHLGDALAVSWPGPDISHPSCFMF